jgi:hypothetical protein
LSELLERDLSMWFADREGASPDADADPLPVGHLALGQPAMPRRGA